MKKLNVSVAQMCCIDGEIEKNLINAEELVLKAHEKNTELLLFPEFMSQGYRLTKEIWDSAEPFNGPTTNWLCRSAEKYNMYIGSSFLEVKNGHFLNTFVLAHPSGKIAGVVRKRYPSMWEAYFFKGFDGEHVFETDFGRVGVGICFDNHTYKVASLIAKGKPDIVLMPHSYCTPTIPNKLTSVDDIERLKSLPQKVAKQYNEILGVPVVMCNKSGDWDSPVPNKIFGIPKNFKFSGKSIIIDSDGRIISEMNESEGIANGKITLVDNTFKQNNFPKHSRYIYPGPAGREIIRLIEFKGYVDYLLSKQRKIKATEVLSNLNT